LLVGGSFKPSLGVESGSSTDGSGKLQLDACPQRLE